jgi:hypothetical protein
MLRVCVRNNEVTDFGQSDPRHSSHRELHHHEIDSGSRRRLDTEHDHSCRLAHHIGNIRRAAEFALLQSLPRQYPRNMEQLSRFGSYSWRISGELSHFGGQTITDIRSCFGGKLSTQLLKSSCRILYSGVGLRFINCSPKPEITT